MPDVLLYLGFLNAVEVADKGTPFGSEDDWRGTLLGYSRGAMDAICWERTLDIEGTPLLPLMRTVEQSFDPR